MSSGCSGSLACGGNLDRCPKSRAATQIGSTTYYGWRVGHQVGETSCSDNWPFTCGVQATSTLYYDCQYDILCTVESEADSISCLNSGNLWLNGACKNQQDICEDSGELGKVIPAKFVTKLNQCLMSVNAYGIPDIICRVIGRRSYIKLHLTNAPGNIPKSSFRMFRKLNVRTL